LSNDIEENEMTGKSAGVGALVQSFKENPVAYMLGLLVLQQAGLLSQATTHLSGVCF